MDDVPETVLTRFYPRALLACIVLLNACGGSSASTKTAVASAATKISACALMPKEEINRITGDVYTGTKREQATESSTGIGFRLLISPPFGGTVSPSPYEGMGQTGGKSCTTSTRDGDYTRTTTTECTN